MIVFARVVLEISNLLQILKSLDKSRLFYLTEIRKQNILVEYENIFLNNYMSFSEVSPRVDVNSVHPPENTDINSDLDDEGRALLDGDIDLEAAEKARAEFDEQEQQMEAQEEQLFEQTQETIQKTEQLMSREDNVSFQAMDSCLNNLDENLPNRGRNREMFEEVKDQWYALQRHITEQVDQLHQTSQDLLKLKDDFKKFDNPDFKQKDYLNLKLDAIKGQNYSLQETLDSIERFQAQILEMTEGVNRWSEDYNNPFTHDKNGYLNEDGENIALQMRMVHLATDELPQRINMVADKWENLESQFTQFAADHMD